MFDSKLNRGRLLVVVFVLAIVGTRLLDRCGADAADNEVARRTAEIRTGLESRKPADLRPFFPGSLMTMPGGPYDFVGPGDDGGLRAAVEIRRGLQHRCIRVGLSADGALTVRTSDAGC